MRRALALARRGLGLVEPNPMVGAVVVRPGAPGKRGRGDGGGEVVGEGYHRRYGGPHAEVEALRAAGPWAKGATLYVTLEPCCHWGKTPPCTDAILATGIRRVVMAMTDPFPQVHGRGAAILRKAGIRVDSGLLEDDARELNAAFICRVQQRRPFIIAKWAQSLDGCIATAGGESKWISGPESREMVQRLRGRVDGILVGIGTALADDPLLTARPQRLQDVRRIATRIVLDSDCRLPLTSRLVKTIPDAPVLLVHAQRLTPAAQRRQKALAARGVMTHGVPKRSGKLDLHSLLTHLATLDYANILVEGGASVLGSLFAARLVDEAHVFIAPLILGGDARHAVGAPPLQSLAEACRLHITDCTRHGPDVHLTLRH